MATDLGSDSVIDGEIAVLSQRGVTHLDDLNHAIQGRQPHRLAFDAFDLLHRLARVRAHRAQGCAARAAGARAASRVLIFSEHLDGDAHALFKSVRELGGEGIQSKRASSRYRAGQSRDWLKAKCSETGTFVVTGFVDERPGKLDHIRVAEVMDGELVEVVQPGT